MYLEDLETDSKDIVFWWPPRMYDWSISGERDIGIRYEGEYYNWRGYRPRSDQMGNIGPGYAFTMLYGPEVAVAISFAAEAWDYADPRGRGNWQVKDAIGSFEANAVGIDQALRDQGQRGLLDRLKSLFIITGFRSF